MKVPKNHSEIFARDSMTMSKALPKLLVWLILLVSASFTVYTTKLLSSPHASCDQQISAQDAVQTTLSIQNPTKSLQFGSSTRDSAEKKTRLEHIIFGIAASAKIWGKRKEYIKLWWNPQEGMRGIVWLDRRVKTSESEAGRLPQLRISSDTSSFAYKNRRGHRSAVRISRIVSETLRSAETENVRWLVMGDDDTVFVAENLVRVLNKYDHEQFYYIGSSSESHLQNINFSYGMAYGGGGFAISYPLAVALEKMQDRCIQRYPGLYGSDDRIQACMAELGVPLTKEVGFHQFDVHGSVFGLLAAHPVAPLVSLHHLDVVDPIFPNATRVQALQRLKTALQLDSAALMQQSICYDTAKSWTVSVSWGFAVQIFRGVLSPREVEMPARTFLNWYKRGDHTAYAFNTRPLLRNPCQKPFVFFLSTARFAGDETETVSVYTQHRDFQPECKWDMADPMVVDRVEVYKKPDPHLWDRSPRRNCCRVLRSEKKSMVVDVGVCREGEMGLV